MFAGCLSVSTRLPFVYFSTLLLVYGIWVPPHYDIVIMSRIAGDFSINDIALTSGSKIVSFSLVYSISYKCNTTNDMCSRFLSFLNQMPLFYSELMDAFMEFISCCQYDLHSLCVRTEKQCHECLSLIYLLMNLHKHLLCVDSQSGESLSAARTKSLRLGLSFW